MEPPSATLRSRLPRLAALAGLAALLGLARPAAAQAVTFSGKQAGLRELSIELEKQTGYDFRLAIGKEAEEARHDLDWKGAPLARVLADLAGTFKVDFFAVDPSGFFVVNAGKPPEGEVKVGAYRLRLARDAEVLDDGTVQVILLFAAPDDQQMEAVAGLSGDLKVLDNFGRSMLPPTNDSIRRTSAPRERLTEYRHSLTLYSPDARAARIRSVAGRLLLFRKVTPLRLELPLAEGQLPQAQSSEGVTVTLERISRQGDELSISTRMTWAESGNLVGRGISRLPVPYLVDDTGRVYRDLRQRTAPTKTGAEITWEQRLRFEDLDGRPVKLVYEVLLREDPQPGGEFRLTNVPLPRREPTGLHKETHPFFDEKGGSLTLRVTDPAGAPLEGEVSLGLSRKEGAGWSGWRWVELVTDPEGRVRLDKLAPGSYRVLEVFRLDPARPPVPSARTPVPVTVTAGKEAALPVLKLPAAPGGG